MTTAAKIIKSEIREITADISKYPPTEKLSDINYETKWVPESLKIFF